MYITMVSQSDNLSITAISFQDGANRQSYGRCDNQCSIATVCQHRQWTIIRAMKNFIVIFLPPIINRIQTNHTQIVIDSPTDGAKYLCCDCLRDTTPILLDTIRMDGVCYSSNSGANFKISKRMAN